MAKRLNSALRDSVEALIENFSEHFPGVDPQLLLAHVLDSSLVVSEIEEQASWLTSTPEGVSDHSDFLVHQGA